MNARLRFGTLALLILLCSVANRFLPAALSPFTSAAAAQSATVFTLSAASYEPAVTPDSIATAFGAQLATATATGNDTDPNTPGVQLPTTLGGTFVEVNGQRAGLFFVSPTQINMLIPANVNAGTANVRVVAGNGVTSTGTVLVNTVSPAIFTANSDGRGVPAAVLLRIKSGGAQSFETLAQLDSRTGKLLAKPIDLGPEGEQVFVILYATGIRRAPDTNNDGNLNETVRAVFAGSETVPQFAGRLPELAGLDQVNVLIPRNLVGRGKVSLSLSVPGAPASNVVEIDIAGAGGIVSPTVTGFGSSSALAGQVVTILGNGFSTTPGQNLVRIGDLETQVTIATPSQLAVIIPFGAESAPVTVRTPMGETRSNSPLQLRTSVSGIVETTSRQPLADVMVQVTSLANGQRVTTKTGPNGVFVAADAPLGGAFIKIIGSSLGTQPMLETLTLPVNIINSRDNPYIQTVYLQPLNGASAQVGGGSGLLASEDTTTLSAPVFAPFSEPFGALDDAGLAQQTPTRIQTGNVIFELPTNSAVLFPDGATRGRITLSQYESSRLPVRFPEGVFSSAVVQLSPLGTRFNPGGKLTFPNPDGYAAGAQLKLFKLDQNERSATLGQFLEVGTATVAGDGQRIETEANAITEAAIYFVANVRQTTTVIGRALDADRTPVRRALVRARGQEQLTDGNGGFIMRNVPVQPGTDQLTVEASLLRPNGRVERLARTGIPVIKDGITNVTPELVFGSATANQPPVLFVQNAFTANAGQTNDLPFFAGDADTEQPVNVTVAGASFATVIRNATVPRLFTLRLTPVIADAGERTLTLTATDNQGATTTQTLRLTVVIPNRPPVANDQRVTTDEDVAKPITLTATDPDNSPLTWMVLTAPTKGALSGTPPNVTYTPNKDFNGSDSFTFKVRDSEFDSNTATVTITVNPVNDAPVLTVPGPQTIKENETLTFTVSGTDVDEGQTLKFTGPSLPSGASFVESTRTFVWKPTFEQAGTYTAAFAVLDNGTPSRSDSKTVTITVTDVNRAPVARAAEVMTDEDKALPIVLAGSDPDGDTITYSVVTPPTKGALSFTAPNLTYTPSKDFNGADSFTFKTNDGKLDSPPAIIGITVKPINDAPVLTVPGPQTVNEGALLSFTVSATDVDAGQTLKFTAPTLPSGASFTEATRTFTWTPTFEQAGNFTVTFVVMDNGTPVLSDTKTVTITVTDVNRAPAARAAEVMTDEDTALAIVLAGNDPDGNTITYSIVTPPTKGALTGTAPNLTYTPNKDYNGADAFTFKVNDGKLDSPSATINIIVKPVNDAPTATAQQVTTDEDTAKAITLAGADIDGDALTFMTVTPPAHGVLSGTAPNLTYTPTPNYNGPDAFTFKVNDGKVDSAPATVSITVRAVPDAPRAVAQTVVTDEDTSKQITLAGTDADNDPLTFMVVTPPRNGILTGTLPTLTYTPRINFNGSDSFTFKVNDGTTDSAPATVNITINGINDPPMLSVPLAQTVAEGQLLTFTVSATDPDSSVIKITAPGLPTGASFIESSRVFSWTPNFDQAGNYTVTFVAADDATPALTDTKTVQIVVTNTNRAPRADTKTVTTNEDTAVPVVLSGGDPDGDTITTMVVTQPQRGALSGTAPNLTYTPNKDVNGTDSFSYKTNDGKLDSALAIVTINITPVNDAPVLNVPGPQTVNEGVKLSFNLMATDVDTGQTLVFSSSNLPNGATLSPDGMFMWTPTNKQAGAYTVNFTVTDNGTPALNNSKTVQITVNNPAPVAVGQAVTLDEDTPKAIVLGVTDADGDALTYTIVNPPQHGTLSGTAPNLTYTPALNYNGADSFSFKANDGTGDSNTATVSLTINPVNDKPVINVPPTQAVNENVALSFTVTGTDVDAGQTLTFSAANLPAGANFNAATATFTWTPDSAQAGDYTVNFTVTDNGTPPLSDTKPVLIRVVNVNRAPTANAQTVVTDEDTAKAIVLTGSDPDGDALTFSIVTPPTKGALTGTAPNLTYTPQANANGPDSFTFKVSDGSSESAVATVSITLNPINDKPVITVPGAQTVAENQALMFTVSASDVDAGQTLTLAATNLPQGATFDPLSGLFVWTPGFAQSGSYTVTFTVTDNGTPQMADSKTVTITVTDTQRVPTANPQEVMTDEDKDLSVVLTGSDPDNDPLTFMIVTQPANGTLSGNAPNLTYTPRANFNGTDAFTFKVNDGKADSNTATISITVKPVNDAPVATPQAVQVTEDTAKQITLAGTDVENDPLTFTVVTQPTKGVLSGTAPNLTYTPNANATGDDSFTFKVNDGKVDSANATVNITIGGVNDPPVANAQQVTTDEDASKQITLTGSDPDGNPLTFMIVTPPTKGTLSGNAPNLLYLPNPNANGTDAFTFKVNDGMVDSAPATVNITINPVNDPPVVLVPGAQMVDEGAQLQFTVTASDVDAGQTLTLSAPNLPTGATFDLATGLFKWTPAFDQMGVYNLNFTATDNGTPPLSDTKTVTITVKDARRAPVANPQAVSTNEDTTLPITLTGSDPDQLPVTFMIVGQPQHGMLTGTAPAVMYVPAANYNGPDAFTFKVNNGTIDSTVATISITVNPVNDAPTITAPDARTATEGEAITFTVTGADVDAGQTLTLSSSTLPSGATFNAATGAFSWTPAFNQSGSYSVTFTVTDNGTPPLSAMKTTTFTINDINRPPVANSFPVTVTEDTATPITLTGSDPDGDTFTFAVVAQPMHGTLSGTAPNLTYTPTLNYNGSDSFTYKTNDGKVDSVNGLVTITVSSVNDKPVITVPGAQSVGTGQAVNFTVTAMDVDAGDVITLSATSVPSGATFNAATGAFSWTPGVTGTFTVSFTATDNGTPQMSDTKTVTITVGQGNRAPSCTAVMTTTDEDVAKQFALTCSDPDEQALTYSVVSQPQSGTVTINGSTATYTPNPNFNGQDSFTFKANDGSADSSPATAMITVNPVCDPPVLTAPGAQIVAIGDELVFTVTASDPDTTSLTLAATNLPPGATFTPTGNMGEFRWRPSVDTKPGDFTVTFRATDDCVPTALTVTKDVTITVSQVSREWEQLTGPEGGKIVAMATVQSGNFNHLFAATQGGGVFRSSNNGGAWTRVNNGLTNLKVTSLIARNGVLYAGTEGDGVFRSLDSGDVWSQFNTGLDVEPYIFNLAVSDTHLYAVTSPTLNAISQTIYRSPLNEAGWGPFNTGLDRNFFVDIQLAGTKLFAATLTQGVFASNASTADWVDFNAGFPNNEPPFVNSLTASGSDVYVGSDLGVFISPVAEAGWVAFNTGLDANARIVTVEALGTTLYARSERLVFQPVVSTIYDIVKSPVSRASWSIVNTGIFNRAVNAFAQTDSNIFAGTEGSGVFRTTDAGANWAQANTGLNAAYILSLFVKDGNLFAGLDGGGVFVSSNNGASWTTANTGLTDLFPFGVNAFATDGTTLYAGTNGRGVYRSTDNGANWTSFNDAGFNNTVVKDLLISDGKLFAATGDTGLYNSPLNNPVWVAVNVSGFTVEALTLFKTTANLFLGTGSGTVYRSSDLTGTTWSQVGNGLATGIPITSFALRGASNFFTGRNGDGTWRSTDNGALFERLVSGMDNQNVMGLRSADTRLYAATNGGGVYVTTDDGTSWKQIITNLTNLRTRAITVKDNLIFVGTEGSGIFNRPVKD